MQRSETHSTTIDLIRPLLLVPHDAPSYTSMITYPRESHALTK